MSEWYKFRSLSDVPDGWCARAGQGVNPYVHSGSPCGSSSGSAIAVAANMVAVLLGTETHSSISCPADYNSIGGLKPTVGLTSRAGVIPMTPRWDTVGEACGDTCFVNQKCRYYFFDFMTSRLKVSNYIGPFAGLCQMLFMCLT